MVAGITRLKTETLSAAIFLTMSNGDIETALVISVILLCIASAVFVAINVSGDTMDLPLLELASISYGAGDFSLSDISLTLSAGEYRCVVGPDRFG